MTSTSTETFVVRNPATGQALAELPDQGAEDARRCAARAAAAQPGWARTPIRERAEMLASLADELEKRRRLLIDLVRTDVGAATRQVAETMQVDAAVERIRRTVGYAAIDLSEPVVDEMGLSARVEHMPVGPTACIAPFNFPLLAMVAKIAPALLMGNAVVMKPAPQDPLVVFELAAACRVVGFPDGVIDLVVGAGAAAGAALVDSPDIAMVSFTGSTSVGVSIAAAAAPTMKRLMLELGGKGALVVADPDALAPAIAGAGRTFGINSGQVCVTPSRVLVPRAMFAETVDRLVDVAEHHVVGDPRDDDVTMGPMVSDGQRDHVAGMLDRAGHAGGEVISPPLRTGAGAFVAPTVVTGVDPHSEIAQREVFGPVLVVLAYDSEDHAVEVANGTMYGLHNYVYASDLDAGVALADRLRGGGVSVNTNARHPAAPFGGTDMSGIGRSGGRHALLAYTELRATVTPARQNN